MGTCYECLSSFTLSSANNCLNDTSCLSNQYKNSSNCANCSTSCLTCVNSTACTYCSTQFGIQLYLKGSSCLFDCGSGYFKYKLGYQCRKCPTECLTCVSSTECTLCLESYFLLLHPIQRLTGTTIGTCVR